MDEPEGAATAKTSEETLMVNLDRAEDESDVMFVVKGPEVFDDGDSLNKVDSGFRSEDVDGGSNFVSKDDNEASARLERESEGRVEDDVSGPARDVDLVSISAEPDDLVNNCGGIGSANGNPISSEEQLITEDAVFIPEREEKCCLNGDEASHGPCANAAGVSSSSEKVQDCPAGSMNYLQSHCKGVALMPKNEETRFKDEEAMYGHVADVGVLPSLEKGEGLVKIPTSSEKVDIIDCFGHGANKNSDPLSEPKSPPSHAVGEDAVPLLPTEKDAKFEDRDMHGDSAVDAELSSSENDEGLVMPTVSEKVDIIDCSGHESNRASDRPSEPNCSQSQIVGEEETMFKDETMCDVGAPSSEKGDGLANLIVSEEANSDCCFNDSNNISDSHFELICSQREIVGEETTVFVPREEETSFEDEALCDSVADAGVSSSEKGEGLMNNPTVSEEIDIDCSGHESNTYSDSLSEPMIPHSQTVAENAAAIPTEEDTKMEDVDMHDSKSEISQSHCKDETLAPREVDASSGNPTASEKVDVIDCSGHESNKVSDSPCDPNRSQSQIVGEEETRFPDKTICDALSDAGAPSSEKDSHSEQMCSRTQVGEEVAVLLSREEQTNFKDEALCDRVADARVSSSEKGKGLVNNLTVSEEIDIDYSGHESNKFSDSPSEPMIPHSQTVAEDAVALIPAEEDTKMEDVDMHGSKPEISQSHCKDDTLTPREVETSLVNPTVSKKVFVINCLGHESNKVSDSPFQSHSVAEDAAALIPIGEETSLKEDMLDSVVDGDMSENPRSHCEDIALMAREVETHFNDKEDICGYVAGNVVVSSSEKVADARPSSLEGNEQNFADPTICEETNEDYTKHVTDGDLSKNSQSHCEDVDSMTREVETSFNDNEPICDNVADDVVVSSFEKGEGLLDNPIFSGKVDIIDCSGHASDRSSPRQTVGDDIPSEEYTTNSDDRDLNDLVADARPSSLEEKEQNLANPTICKETNEDYTQYATDKISDCAADAVIGVGQIGVLNENDIKKSKVEDMNSIVDDKISPYCREGLEGDKEDRTTIHDKAESFKSSEDHQTSAENDAKDKSEVVLSEPQCSTQAAIDIASNDDDLEPSDATHNSFEKQDMKKTEVEVVIDSQHRTPSNYYAENDACLETSINNDAMDIDDEKIDVMNATNLGSINESDVVQNDEMDVDEEKLDVANNAANLGSTKVTDIPDNTQALDNKIVANFALKGLDGHEAEPNDAVGLDTNKGTEVMGEQIVDNSAFEFIDEGFWPDDDGRNASMARSEGAPNNDQTGTLKSLVEGVVTLEEDTTTLADIKICKQQSTMATCKPNMEVYNGQNTEVTPIADQPVRTDVSHVAVDNEVDIEQAAEVEKGPSKTNNGYFLDDVHGPETMFLDDEQQHEEEADEEENKDLCSENLELKQQKEIEEKEVKPVNIYPGFLHPPEKSRKFTVSDLVWGKVRSHPWWPGQIFDPADASEKAVRYYKKGCFLVAYFGDRTFAWNDASLLKPFCSHFSQIEKQSTSDAFQNAVRCALEEVFRRIQLGLSCSCTPKSSYSKIACQIVENTGIREESSRIKYSVDKCTAGVNSFSPDKLLQFLRGKACSPTSSCDQLDLVIARAQLLAHSRFKGCGELSDFLQGGELLENDDNAGPVTSNMVTPSLKRKHNSSKERRVSEIIGSSSELDCKSEGAKSVYAAKVSPVTPNPPPFKIGERILRAASHLKGDCGQPEIASGGHAQNPPSNNELYSQLQLVARAPTGEYTFLDTFIRTILDFRKCSKQLSELVLQNPLSSAPSGRPANVGGSKKRKSSQAAVDEGFEFDDDVNDSYWTDMIVQNYSEDQQPLQYSVVDSSVNKSSGPNKKSRRSYSRKRYSIGKNSTPDVVLAAAAADEGAEKRKRDPAELILKFGEGGGWLPSEMNLNKIFRRFGPIKELETEVHPECCRGRVVFKRGCDAEVAYSSAGKFNIFGSLPVNYEINYTPVISVRPMLLTIPQEQEQEAI